MSGPQRRRVVILLAVLLVASFAALRPDAIARVWERVARLIDIRGEQPIAADPPILSDYELSQLDDWEPQQQAERLLERAINNYGGAREQIADRIDGWRGRVRLAGALETHYVTALNANDLRMRAVAAEIYLAAYNVPKTAQHARALMDLARREAETRATSLWKLGLLAGRGVTRDESFEFLLTFLHHPEEQVRHWATEGLGAIGIDRTIPPLLEVLRTDESPTVRERAACSLSSSGLLTRQQRLKAFPGLLELAQDESLDAQTRGWVFQALAHIAGVRLPQEVAAWEEWFWTRPEAPEALDLLPHEEGEAALEAPQLLVPEPDSEFSHVPRMTRLDWQAVESAKSYNVEVDCFNCCARGEWCADRGTTWRYTTGLTQTTHGFEFVGAQSGRWRVWAVDGYGKAGPVSQWRTFDYRR
ncbi:MAG: HEAT repeat domain-containing protein [bacterium]|nr:HEAT repeat domain-containing protein [bacterium]